MKWELTTGVALSVGLVVLFGFGFGAVEKMVHSSARAKAVEAAIADARGASLGAEVGWHKMVERYRAVVRSSVGGPVLSKAPWTDNAEALTDSLASMLERAGGSGFAGALVPGRVVATAGRKAPSVALDTFAAVSDSFAGATSARLEVMDDGTAVAIAAPVRSDDGSVEGVVVVVVPVNDTMLRQWTLMDAVAGAVVILGPKGQVLAATLPQDTRADLKTADFSKIFFAGAARNQIRSEYVPSMRPLTDDRGEAASLVGVGTVDRGFLSDLTGKVGGMVKVLGAMAILMALLVSALTPSTRGEAPAAVAAVSVVPQPVVVSPPMPMVPPAATPPVVVPNLAVDPSNRPHPVAASGGSLPPAVAQPPAAPPPAASAPSAPEPAAPPPSPPSGTAEQADEKFTKGKGMSPRPGNYEVADQLGTPASQSSDASKPFVAPGPRSQPPSAGPVSFDPIAAAASMSAGGSVQSEPPAAPPSSGGAPNAGAPAPMPSLPALGQPQPSAARPSADAMRPLPAAPPQPSAFGGPQDSPPPASFGAVGGGLQTPMPPQPVAPPPMAPQPVAPPPMPPQPVAPPPMPPQPVAAPPMPPQPVAAPPMPPQPVAAPPMPPQPMAPPPMPPLPGAPGPGMSGGVPSNGGPVAAPPSAVPLPASPPGAPVLAANALADAGNTIAPAVPAPEALHALQAAVVLPFDERHYRSVFDHFVGSKQQLGENTAALRYDGFATRLRNSEEQLIEQHGCRAVRFQVQVKDHRVSLRPQLVR